MLATATQTVTYETSSSGGGAIVLVIALLAWLAFAAIYIVSAWKIWQKMGDAGWMGIVPLLNLYRVFQRTRPDQAIVFTIGSFFCFVFAFIGLADLAKLFGKDAMYAIGLIFLPFIFLPMLAFGSAQYQGPPPPALS